MRIRTQGKESPPANKKAQDYRKKIELLKEETKKLKAEISLDKIQTSALGSDSYIARLQDQGDSYSRKIKLEKQKVEDLDNKILEVQKLIEEKRKTINNNKEKKESNNAVLAKIKKTEHKLDKTLQKYNEAVAENKNLREEIDALRREKKVFRNIFTSLEEEYLSKVTEKETLMKEKESAIKKRDDAKKKLETLNENMKQTEKELENFSRDWQEVEKIIEKKIKISEFIHETDEIPTEPDQPRTESPIAILKDKELIKESMKMVEKYEEAFKKIEIATGITDVDALVNTFIEAEQQNYSLFNYVNELTNEIEKLETQISGIKQDIEEFKGQGIRTENQRKKVMTELEGKLALTESRAETYERKYEKTMVTVNSLKLGIEQILEKIGCNNPTVEEMVKEQGITEGNMMQCLSIIELRTNEILQMYDWCTNSVVDGTPHTKSQGKSKKIVKYEPDTIPVITDSAEDDEGNAPLTSKDFWDKILKKEAEGFKRNK
jgi:chromosome segregation ATPase